MSWLESTVVRRAVEAVPVVLAVARSRWSRVGRLAEQVERLEAEVQALRFEVQALRAAKEAMDEWQRGADRAIGVGPADHELETEPEPRK